jgi:Glycosyl transferase family 11
LHLAQTGLHHADTLAEIHLMVIVRITGGLGNQLFMYAAGRRLALHHATPLKLDISGYGTYLTRLYHLDQFHLAQDLASPEDIARFKSAPSQAPKRKRAQLRWNPFAARRSEADGGCVFQAGDSLAGTYLPEILRTPRDVYLDGYWQSEQYFKPVEQVIRGDLRFRSELAGDNLATAQQISGVAAVSLHIRRGDYATNRNLSEILGLLPLEYYHRAIERIAATVAAPHFFVFSDDPGWAKDNLRIGFPASFVCHNGPAAPHEDLRLMSLCRYHITANSSLSWWGAWLCENSAKTIIAPERWFLKVPMSDIVPAGWIRL